MKKLFLTALTCLSAWTGAEAAPEWPINNNNVMAVQPKELRRDIIKQSDLDQFMKTGQWGQPAKIDKGKDNYWNVWSDRSHNKTYNGPSESSGQYKELNFNQSLRIAKIEKGYALVYEEPMQGLKFPLISQEAKCLGWIKMDHLLLWESCPTNDLGIYYKALIVANVERWAKADDKEDYDKSYKNPETKDGESEVKTDMTFYFVMKTEGNYVLLGKSSKMSKGSTDQQLYAWVSKDTYISWDQRTCLEGNWDPIVAENLKGKKVSVYRDGEQGTWIELGKENGATHNPATKYRMPRLRLRFPLFESVSDTQYSITAFAKPEGKEAELQEDDNALIDIASQADEIKANTMEETNKINLIVVIDGTSSMGNYYKPMQDAIQKAYETFGNQNGIKVKAGVVIYRDYADGEYMIETLPLTDPSSVQLKEFLLNGGKYGIKSSPKDRTAAEALYQGLNAALDAKHMGYNKVNSNLMFVVGDCGNDANDTKINQQDIIDKCAALNVNIVAFQVRNKDDASFNDFRRQMGAILRGNLKKQYPETIKWNVLPDGIVLKEIENVQLPVMASMRNADKGEEMSPQKLNDIIKENYIRFENVIKGKLKNINNSDEILAMDTTRITDPTLKAQARLNIAMLKNILTEKKIATIRTRGLLTAFQGQTEKKAPNGQDYWKPVLFITGDELGQLLETLKIVYNGASSGRRKAYVDSMKKLIQTILPGITDDEMNNKDIQEVMDLITGLIVKTESLSRLEKLSILDIQDEKLVPPAEFDRIVTDFKDKYEYLNEIHTHDYEFSALVQGVRWYWIPIEAMP